MVLLRTRGCIFFLALVLGAGIWSLATLRFETHFLQILPAHLPSVRGLSDFAKAAAGRETFFVIVNPDLPAGERERIVAKLRPALEAGKEIARIEAPGETFFRNPGSFAAWMLANAPPEVFSKALESFDPERMREQIAGIPERLRGAVDPMELIRVQWDPLGVFDFSGRDRVWQIPTDSGMDASFLMGWSKNPESSTEGDCLLLDELNRIVFESLGESERLNVRLTGDGIFNAQISRQMKGDINKMIAIGLILLAGAFYMFYRTLAPLPWILFFQTVTMFCGLIAARVCFGHLNVISMGFASILLGVGMDYHILVYHHFGSPHRSDQSVWNTLRRSIWMSALVTAASFFLLGFSTFPGLRQMSVLVGTGLLSTALCATWLLSKVLAAAPPQAPEQIFKASGGFAAWIQRNSPRLRWAVCALVAGFTWYKPWNHVEDFYRADLETLQPSGISAFEGHTWLQRYTPDALASHYLMRSPSARALRDAAEDLALGNEGMGLSVSVWGVPDEENFQQNLRSWRKEIPELIRVAFEQSNLGEEWTRVTLQFAESLAAAFSGKPEAFLEPKNFLRTQSGADERGFYAVVRVDDAVAKPDWARKIESAGSPVLLLPVSWKRLKEELTVLAREEFEWLGICMIVAVVCLCWIAQKSVRLVCLNLLALALSLGVLGVLLLATGTPLTPLTLVSVPLLLGLVIDYSLHLLMALEKLDGDLRETFHHLAAPVVLTGLSASVGFGAPMLTAQPAMRNFGLVMDLGIFSAVSACLVLLPPFYLWMRPARDYRERLFYKTLYAPVGFKVILWGWRWCGGWICKHVARAIGLGYALTHPRTVDAVRKNLALMDPRKNTFGVACRLFMNQAEAFTQYGRLADHPPERVLEWMGGRSGLDYLQKALEKGGGCLLVTGHFGFFEFGGLLLSKMGFPITAITLPEPSAGLTEWRAQFRRRWEVETIVIGDGSLGALDVVRAIHQKRFVALLVDRPFDEKAVPVKLPHGSMLFSTGPALIALLAQCPIVPVGIVQQPDGLFNMVATGIIYPQWLPEGRAASLEHLTRLIAEQLLPLFQNHPEQWYHFHPLDLDPTAELKASPSHAF
jgi:lauroyl/myristoyl acyltransferase